MRIFDPIDPLTIDKNPHVVARLPDDKNPTKTWYILIMDNYALLATCTYFTDALDGESEWLHYQLEMPKRSIPWIIDTLENKFFKTSREGGLSYGRYSYEEVVDGEKLQLGRAFAAGGDGVPGYQIHTLDRRDEDGFSKYFNLPDPLLFEHGMFDWLKEVAAKITAGKI